MSTDFNRLWWAICLVICCFGHNVFGKSFEQRIINGQEVKVGSNKWPFMAVMVGKTLCGGTVINYNTILTAGHCVSNFEPKGYVVYLGHEDLSSDIDKTYLFHPSKFIPHENYDPSTEENDIGIIKLETKIDFKTLTKVKQTCFSTAAESSNIDTENCYVVGWGVTQSGDPSTKLNELPVPVMDDSTCDKYCPSPIKYKPSLMLCAGFINQDKGAFHGDSGGPLVCPLKNDSKIYSQIGVVNFGKDANSPCYYARTSKFLDWIEKKAIS